MNRLEKSRNFTPNTGKNEILASFYFYFFFHLLIEVYLLNRFLHVLNSLNKTLKNTGKWKENTGRVREICQPKNVGTMVFSLMIANQVSAPRDKHD